MNGRKQPLRLRIRIKRGVVEVSAQSKTASGQHYTTASEKTQLDSQDKPAVKKAVAEAVLRIMSPPQQDLPM